MAKLTSRDMSTADVALNQWAVLYACSSGYVRNLAEIRFKSVAVTHGITPAAVALLVEE